MSDTTPLSDVIASLLKQIGDKLVSKVGTVKAGAFTDLLRQYAPVVANMTEAEINAWCVAAETGDTFAAKVMLDSKLSNADLLAAMDANNDALAALNVTNAANMDLQRNFVASLAKILIGLGGALVIP